MINPTKDSASRGATGAEVAGREAKATTQKKILRCDVHRTSKIRSELRTNGVGLSNTAGFTQRETLLRALQYLGDRGINTPEAVACGYYRIATRIQELEEAGWLISVRRETIFGEDGLVHINMARYVLIGRRNDSHPVQAELGLEVPA